MLWPGIKQLGRELGLKRTNSKAAGVLKNCFVNMYDGNGTKTLELFAPGMDDADTEYIASLLKQNKIKNHEWLPKGVKITFHEAFIPYSIAKIKNILNTIVDFFGGKYPQGRPSCYQCGLDKDAGVYCINGEPLYVCGGCLREIEDGLNAAYLEYQQSPTNYVSGFAGALLFSIPGIIVSALCSMFLEQMAALMPLAAVVYSILVVKGYKAFKGKSSPFGALIVTAAWILMTGIGTVMGYLAFIIKEFKTGDIDMIRQILKTPKTQALLIIILQFSYAFSGAYFIPHLLRMKQAWKCQTAAQELRDI